MISPASFTDNQTPSPTATGAHTPSLSINPATTHDADLVRRFQTGDENAFTEIVARHRGKMHSIALGHLRNHADAEEIAQDTFIHAHRGLARFRGDSSLASWLYRIVFNLSRNRHGYFARRHRNDTCSLDCKINEDNTTTLGDFIVSDTPNPQRDLTNREFLTQVTACMKQLDSRQRQILKLRVLQDRSYEEIATLVGISPGTVKSRIARARKNLRELLAHAYGETDAATEHSLQWFEAVRPIGRMAVAFG